MPNTEGDYLEESNGPSEAVKKETAPDRKEGDVPKNVPKSAPKDEQKANERPKRSLFDMIDPEKNPEAEKLRLEIEEVRKGRHDLIDQIKAVKRRLNYKLAESETIEKLLNSEPDKDVEGRLRKARILKRQKARLEFKISTEASSLTDEKALIRRIKEISSELDTYMRFVRLVRKRDLVKGDITEYAAKAGELNNKILEFDKRLDSLYDGLRKALNIEQRSAERQPRKRTEKKQQPMQEVNLEDIAVIKKRK